MVLLPVVSIWLIAVGFGLQWGTLYALTMIFIACFSVADNMKEKK